MSYRTPPQTLKVLFGLSGSRRERLEQIRATQAEQFEQDQDQDRQLSGLWRENQELRIWLAAMLELLVSKGLAKESEVFALVASLGGEIPEAQRRALEGPQVVFEDATPDPAHGHAASAGGAPAPSGNGHAAPGNGQAATAPSPVLRELQEAVAQKISRAKGAAPR